MVKHIVMFTFKDNFNSETKEEIIRETKAKLENLKDSIDSIVFFEVGINFNTKNTYDLVINSEFIDEDGLEYYQQHPAHQEVSRFIGERRIDRASVDYKF